MAKEKKNFSWKGWVSLFTLLSFIIDTVSGIILYISPPGRIANWTNWKIWGLTKEEWGAIHTIFGYVLLIIICFHIYYNWKIFWNYIWSKVKKAFNLKKEMIGAIIISILVFLGTLWNIPPFSSTMELGEYFKESWEDTKVETPGSHAELQTLEEFAENIKVPVDQVLKILKDKGYKIENAQQTVNEIAKMNNVSPNKIYEDIKAGGAKPEIPKVGTGTGMGKKTIELVCSEMGIPIEDAIARIKEKGVDAKPDDIIKNIAVPLGLSPMEVFDLMKGEK